jgi:hypothetical protein
MDLFGRSLAAGDYDGDGRADLAIGVPGEKVVELGNGHGGVAVLYGSAAGLTTAGSDWFDQSMSGVPGRAEPGDEFGSVLVALIPPLRRVYLPLVLKGIP